MKDFSKISEARKEVSAQEQAQNFQILLKETLVKTERKEVQIAKAVKAHQRKLDRLMSANATISKLRLNDVSDFGQAFEHFMDTVNGITEETLAELIPDVLIKRLDKCVNEEQKKIFIDNFDMNNEATLRQIDRQRTLYIKLGYLNEEGKIPEKKTTSGTRQRRRKQEVNA
jgi:hypothetical protein